MRHAKPPLSVRWEAACSVAWDEGASKPLAAWVSPLAAWLGAEWREAEVFLVELRVPSDVRERLLVGRCTPKKTWGGRELWDDEDMQLRPSQLVKEVERDPYRALEGVRRASFR